MANATLADLPAQSSAEGADLLYIVPDGGASKKITVANLFGSANTTGTLASQPSADFSGRMFYPSDSLYAFRDSGSSWSAFGPLFPLTPPPAVNTWTWVNQNSATTDETNGGIYLESPSIGGGSQFVGLFRSAPATPYTIVACVMLNLSDDVSWSVFYLAWRDSSSGKIASTGLYTAGGNNNILFRKWNSATSINSDYGSSASQISLRPYIFLRITDTGTDRTFSVSSDGYKFNQRHTTTHADFLTPNQVGFGVEPNGATAGGRVISWRVT